MSARRSDAAVLDDICEAAEVAAEIVSKGRPAFDADAVLRFAAEAAIARIGDASTKLSDETVAAISEIPWREIRGMRIVVAHAYHRLNYDRVWNTLTIDVPALVEAIVRFRAD